MVAHNLLIYNSDHCIDQQSNCFYHYIYQQRVATATIIDQQGVITIMNQQEVSTIMDQQGVAPIIEDSILDCTPVFPAIFLIN